MKKRFTEEQIIRATFSAERPAMMRRMSLSRTSRRAITLPKFL